MARKKPPEGFNNPYKVWQCDCADCLYKPFTDRVWVVRGPGRIMAYTHDIANNYTLAFIRLDKRIKRDKERSYVE